MRARVENSIHDWRQCIIIEGKYTNDEVRLGHGLATQ
jgi:hypothetical protein